MPIGPWRRKPERLVEGLQRCPYCGAGVEIYSPSCRACGRELVETKIAIFRRQRDAGMMSEAAFNEIVSLLESGPTTNDSPTTSSKVRKQLSDLVASDLERYPIWEFAIDEEGEEGRDEETVKPRPELEIADPAEGIFIVRAEFTAADGTRFDGFVSPHEENHIGYLQPTILTEEGRVPFWFGVVPPGTPELDASYRQLGKTAAQLFPLRYRALVEHAGTELEDEINGFMHYERAGTDRITLLT
jgi:hypothetical protein